jgi:hypothetical protein
MELYSSAYLCTTKRFEKLSSPVLKDEKGVLVPEGMMEPKTRLLDHMRNVMRLKHMSLRTEEAYVSWVKRFILYRLYG